MKKSSLITQMVLGILLLLPAAMQAQGMTEVQYLVLTETDGAISKFALSDGPVLTYKGGNVVVTCGEQAVETSMDAVASCTFNSERVSTGIETIAQGTQGEQSSFAFGTASFEGMKAGGKVVVYTLDGKAVATTTADAEGRASVSLAGLQRGVYILRTPSKSYKINK